MPPSTRISTGSYRALTHLTVKGKNMCHGWGKPTILTTISFDGFLQSTLSPDRKRLLGVKDSMQTVHNSLYKPKFHLLRHFTTRHNALSVAHAFWYRKKSYVLCRRCCAARSAQHVATSATDVIRNSVCSVVCIKLRSP